MIGLIELVERIQDCECGDLATTKCTYCTGRHCAECAQNCRPTPYGTSYGVVHQQ
jgi:hypothetical protein